LQTCDKKCEERGASRHQVVSAPCRACGAPGWQSSVFRAGSGGDEREAQRRGFLQAFFYGEQVGA